MSEPALYQAPLRPRIATVFASSLRDALGKRDFSKGERASLQEVLVSMIAQATHLGFPSMPIKDGDPPELAALKHRKLDGVASALHADERGDFQASLDARPAFSDVERELLPRLLAEAIHDFRPHAGHQKAVPTHVVEAQRARADKEARAASGHMSDEDAMERISHAADKLAVEVDGRLGAVYKRLDEQDGKLDAILSHLKAQASGPAPAPSPDAAPPAADPSEADTPLVTHSHKKHR